MRKLILSFLVIFAPISFAGTMAPDEASSPDCEAIAKLCLDAGYSREGGEGKAFWHDCMKPVLFGKQVNGVTVDTKVVRDCRKFKIQNLQEQLNELKKYKDK